MRARILTQVVIAFLTGIVGARYGHPLFFLTAAACLALVWNAAQGIRGAVIGVAVCVAASLLGGLRWQDRQELFQEVEQSFSDGEAVMLWGTVFRKEESTYQSIYYIKDSYFSKEKGRMYAGQGLIYLDDSTAERYRIGDTLQFQGKFQSFQKARNEGNFDREAFYHGKNIAFQVKADEVAGLVLSEDAPFGERLFHGLEVGAGRWKEWLYQLRRRIRPVYARHLPASRAGVLSVMTLGDKGLLEAETKTLYQQAGISHVLAISGLHISLLGMGIFRLLRRVGLPYGISGLAAGILLVCFGQLAGMEVSTSRAVLMFLVMLLGGFSGMSYDSLTALSLSALLQLWDNPLVLWYGGFQFSYAAVLAVVVVSGIYRKLLPGRNSGERERRREGFRERLTGWLKGLGETVLVSVCIQLVTLPLTLWSYYEFPLYTVLINGLLLPFMGIILFLGIAGGAVGLALPGLSWLILQPAGLLLWWNETVCRLFLRLPLAQVITGCPGLEKLYAYYGLLGGCLLLMWYGKRRLEGEKSGKWIVCRGLTLILALLPAAGLLWLAAAPGPAEFRIAFLDVGQGDGIYLRSAQGGDFFVDGGSSDVTGVGDYRILSFLKYHGIRGIDGWFVSHADKDHISGLLEVWDSGYPIRQLLLAEGMVRDEAWQELVEQAGEHGTEVIYLTPGQRVVSGELTFVCLAPEPVEDASDRNGASMVLLAECQGIRTLLNGDISQAEEQKLMEAFPKLRVDVYKAAHHGSNYSNAGEFLELLKPLVSVVSCGEENRYGHPGAEAVAHMEETGSEVLYTMESGQITIRSSDGKIEVQEFVTE